MSLAISKCGFVLKRLIGFIAFWIAVGMLLMLFLTHHYLIALIIIALLLLIGYNCYLS